MAPTTRLASHAGGAAAAAAVDGQWFSSKTLSLFPRPTEPPPSKSLNPRILSSLFPTPAEITSSYPENSRDESRVGVSIRRLQKFSQTYCNSGNLCADEELPSINRMQPWSSLYSFNLFLNRLAKKKRYSDVFWHFSKMNSARLVPNLYTLNILLKCFCNANGVGDGFVVMGKIVTSGYSPNFATFTSLIKGLFIEGKVADAVELFLKLEKFGCCPDVVACNTFIHGLCRSGNTSNAVTLLEEMVYADGQYGIQCKPDIISYSCIIDGLRKEGKEYMVTELFLEMQAIGLFPDLFIDNSLMNNFCSGGMLREVRYLFDKMLDRGTRFDVNALIHGVCRSGNMNKAITLLEKMVSANGQYRNDVISYRIMEGLRKEGKEDKAWELFLEMHVKEWCPYICEYISLLNDLCCVGELKEARFFFHEILDLGTQLDVVTFNMLINVLRDALLVIDRTSLFAVGSQDTV